MIKDILSARSLATMLSKRGGIAKSNRFMIFMKPPSYSFIDVNPSNLISSFNNQKFDPKKFLADPRDIAFLCSNTVDPGKQILTDDYTRGRNFVKTPYAYINEDLTMSFLLTNDYYIKRMFLQWENMIIDPRTYRLNFHDQYSCDIYIVKLNDKGWPTYGMRLKDAFPTTTTSIEMNHASSDSAQQLNVSFTYSDKEEVNLSSAIDGLESLSNSLGDITGANKESISSFIDRLGNKRNDFIDSVNNNIIPKSVKDVVGLPNFF